MRPPADFHLFRPAPFNRTDIDLLCGELHGMGAHYMHGIEIETGGGDYPPGIYMFGWKGIPVMPYPTINEFPRERVR